MSECFLLRGVPCYVVMLVDVWGALRVVIG